MGDYAQRISVLWMKTVMESVICRRGLVSIWMRMAMGSAIPIMETAGGMVVVMTEAAVHLTDAEEAAAEERRKLSKKR